MEIKIFKERRTFLVELNTNILGIICEYNPFHNGHLYHLLESKEIAGASHTIAVMSGNFVQRRRTCSFR